MVESKASYLKLWQIPQIKFCVSLKDLMSHGYVMWTWCTTMVSINNIFAASRYQCLEAC
nr:hypothetical protein [Tanacetum cinerariifolium]